ncbi:hypothetical protein DVH05_021490 [Phytophthora capsici]|nr:hypothetical protein DVH05_021490 [Phytophthora capsici]
MASFLHLLLLIVVALSVSVEAKSLSRSKDISQVTEERGVSQMDDMLKLLKLDEGVDKLVANPNLKAFMDYWGKYSIQNPRNEAIKSATAAYGDDIMATILQTAKKVSGTKVMAEKLLGDQRIFWLDSKLSPYDVFKLLKLDDVATKPLNNPALDTWTSYLTLFNYVNPGKETTMIKTFTQAYGDEALAKMLLSAKEVAATENLAKSLQLGQFTRWMRKGKNPDKIYLNVFKLHPKLKTIPEPYQSILNQYHSFYQLHVRKS